MMRYLLLLLFVFAFTTNTQAQKVPSDFEYVVVPDQFSFLFEKDQFQLCSLTKFLFNKHGFNAYFATELPNVDRCSGLYADVIRDNGFVWTKLYVELRDCKGNLIFRSIEGRSKLKEYGKAYNEALRVCFESIAALEVDQPDPTILVAIERKTEPDLVEVKKDQIYVYQDYQLKVGEDASIKVFHNDKEIGSLVPTSKDDIFMVRTDNFYGVAYKTESGFTVEREKDGQEAPEVITFTLQE